MAIRWKTSACSPIRPRTCRWLSRTAPSSATVDSACRLERRPVGGGVGPGAGLLEGLAHPEDGGVIVGVADDLDAGREAALRVPAWDGQDRAPVIDVERDSHRGR